jgi:hypothetical protein
VSEPLEKPHRGVDYSRVPAAGVPGLVLAVGAIWMFWFGAPDYRPIVIAVATLGVVAAGLLIAWRAKHARSAEKSVLHLRECQPCDGSPDGKTPSAGAGEERGSLPGRR